MKQLQSTGIHLKFSSLQGWAAEVQFSTFEHAQSSCIEGSIGPRYFGELAAVIDLAKDSAESMGVTFINNELIQPTMYIEGDGEDPKVDLPENWRALIQEQCERLGWRSVYTDKVFESPRS